MGSLFERPIWATRLFDQKCGVLSDLMLCIFYFIIGINSPIMEIANIGLPLLSLILTTLSVHIAAILGFCRFVNIISRRMSWKFQIDLDTVLIARYVS